MANPNFTVKLDLASANTIRRALARHRDASLAEANEHDGSLVGADKAKLAREEAGRAEDLLRRDFPGV